MNDRPDGGGPADEATDLRGPDDGDPVPAAWPREDEWPAADAPPRAWAYFYRDRLGWTPYPTPSPHDLARYEAELYRQRSDHLGDGEADYDAREDLRRECADEAHGRRKGPLPGLTPSKYPIVSDEMIDRWWGGPHGPHRGICVRVGCSSLGTHPMMIEVDPRHGGDVAGEFGEGLSGPAFVTPSGGRNTIVFHDPRARHGQGRIAVGVDVVCAGLSTICLPAGASTPGREWVHRAPPGPCPAATWEGVEAGGASTRATGNASGGWRRERVSPGTGQAGGGVGEGGGQGSGAGAFVLREPAVDRDRMSRCGTIVGVLARPGACPGDFVAAALELLAEDLACGDAPADRHLAEQDRWRAALTRGPRDAAFAAEVVAAWSRCRDQEGRARWTEAYARRHALGFWKSSARRDPLAGAEDRGVGPGVGSVPAFAAEFRALAAAMPQPAVVATQAADGVITSASAVAVAAAPLGGVFVAPAPAVVLRVDPQTLFRSLWDAYPPDVRAEDEARRPVRLDRLPAFQDFVRTGPDDAYPHGHGLGPWLGAAIGGLVPGDVKAFGAPGGKGGKTYFVGQFVDGLALQTALRLMGVPEYAEVPLVVPYWVSEMPKEGEVAMRMVARSLGLDAKAITQGVDAARAVDARDGFTAAEVVSRARQLAAIHERDRFAAVTWAELGCAPEWREMHLHAALRVARQHVAQEIDLSRIPEAEGTGRQRVVHDGGPRLVAYVAEAIQWHRRAFAERWGVAEEDVLPLPVWDPAQRWAGDDGHDAKAALDATLRAVVNRLCRRSGGVSAAVVLTSDTTKAAAKEVTSAHFCHADARGLAAEIFAGSQGIMHAADAIGVCADPPVDATGTALMRVRVLQARTGAPSAVYPFTWDLRTGRFRPLDPASVPLPPKPERWGERGSGEGGGGGGGGGSGGNAPRPPQTFADRFGRGRPSSGVGTRPGGTWKPTVVTPPPTERDDGDA